MRTGQRRTAPNWIKLYTHTAGATEDAAPSITAATASAPTASGSPWPSSTSDETAQAAVPDADAVSVTRTTDPAPTKDEATTAVSNGEAVTTTESGEKVAEMDPTEPSPSKTLKGNYLHSPPTEPDFGPFERWEQIYTQMDNLIATSQKQRQVGAEELMKEIKELLAQGTCPEYFTDNAYMLLADSEGNRRAHTILSQVIYFSTAVFINIILQSYTSQLIRYAEFEEIVELMLRYGADPNLGELFFSTKSPTPMASRYPIIDGTSDNVIFYLKQNPC
jgi:ATP-dependent exoDNAse (exonuclease V) beta subunit